MGLSYVLWNTYQGEVDKPDILILSMLSGLHGKVIDGLLDCRNMLS